MMVYIIFMFGHLTFVYAVTDAELEALEEQLEQQELQEKQDLRDKLAEEKRKNAQALQRIKREQEEKRLAEQEKQRQEEKQLNDAARLAEQERLRQKEELKNKYMSIINEADLALSNKDKVLAIKKYNEALVLFPDDVVATLGVKKAEILKHKLCYDVLGKWIWGKALGQEFIILHDNGTIDYQTFTKGSGSWECTSPETRTIKIRISMAGFSNEWLSTYSADGRCLLGPESWGERGCYHRPDSSAK